MMRSVASRAVRIEQRGVSLPYKLPHKPVDGQVSAGTSAELVHFALQLHSGTAVAVAKSHQEGALHTAQSGHGNASHAARSFCEVGFKQRSEI
jgi:hypothetical protein